MKILSFLLSGLLLLLLGCSQDDTNNTALKETLKNKAFILQIDRGVGNPDAQFPSDQLTENEYISLNQIKSYEIRFSSDGSVVYINDDISGILRSNEKQKNVYELTEGVFAGGRFVVWTEDGSMKAELTIYGSGVPIISSERGTLVIH